MSGCGGIRIMLSVPEKSTVKSVSIFARVVDIDVDHVLSEIACEFKPAAVTATQVLNDRSGYNIILIVVMRDPRTIFCVTDGFVIGVKIPKVTPTIFIDDLTPVEKTIAIHNRRITQPFDK